MKKKKRIVGDELDDYYLKGDHDYTGIGISIVIAIFVIVAFWPKKG